MCETDPGAVVLAVGDLLGVAVQGVMALQPLGSRGCALG